MSSVNEAGRERGAHPAQWGSALIDVLRAAPPPLLFGLRLWASVCLALYLAFWLELDNAFWAGTSAAIVCQPHLGASLRKGWFRMIGTLVGGVAIVVLTACFPQDRAFFLIGLALWGAACALVATLLRNFAAYAASLAGYTAAIIASDQLGATGGPNGDAFMLAIWRVSEIWLGIVCAGIVLAGTDFGGAHRRLAGIFAAVSAEIAARFGSTLALAGSTSSDTQQPHRRELVRKVVALDPVIDEAVGESSTLRYHSPVLQSALNGLLAALTAWRNAAVRLTRLPTHASREDADAVLRHIPQQLRSVPAQGEQSPWIADPAGMRSLCGAAVRTLIAMPVGAVSPRLLAYQSAKVLAGLMDTLDALALLTGKPVRAGPHQRVRLHVPDWWPAFVNAGRAFVAIGAAELFWIITAWPNGAFAITFTAIVVTLLAPRADEAYAFAFQFTVGNCLGVAGAAIVEFALLPKVETFVGFSIVIGLYLVPVAALVAQPWQTAMFIGMTYNFVPLLQPANQMIYDTAQFYNTALAIVAGSAAGALSFRLLPPLSPAFRTRRLLMLTLRDLRRMARDPVPPLREEWEGRMYARIAVLPNAAEPLQRAQVVTALSVGSEIIDLRRMAPQLGGHSELEAALTALAQGDAAAATARLDALDRRLAALPDTHPLTSLALRARTLILLISDALVQHRAYFEQGAPA
ncbi:MAG TPA: FUSC family protein [Xanthobacteraceae bacterium]|nr:FUSC family protein [Xanthobacteraceae bacterium]